MTAIEHLSVDGEHKSSENCRHTKVSECDDGEE